MNTMTPTGETDTHQFFETSLDGQPIKLIKEKATGQLLFDADSVAIALGYPDASAMLADKNAVEAIREYTQETGDDSIRHVATPGTPIELPAPKFYYADYQLARAYDGYHVRQGPAIDNHPMLPDQVLLYKPLRPTSNHTAAKARTANRGCKWWVEWSPSPQKNTYYEFAREGDGVYLLVFYQPRPGYQQPFRLICCPVEESFPKVAKLWPLIADYLASLPALPAQQSASSLND